MNPELPSWVHNPTWLDSNNFITFVRWKDEVEPYMALWYHRPRELKSIALEALKGWCSGGFGWRNPAPDQLIGNTTWTLESLDPLTVSPSLLCLDCKAHGFIREGKWVPA